MRHSASCRRRRLSLRRIAAIQAALSRDIDPMTKVFREVIARTLKSVARTSSV